MEKDNFYILVLVLSGIVCVVTGGVEGNTQGDISFNTLDDIYKCPSKEDENLNMDSLSRDGDSRTMSDENLSTINLRMVELERKLASIGMEREHEIEKVIAQNEKIINLESQKETMVFVVLALIVVISPLIGYCAMLFQQIRTLQSEKQLEQRVRSETHHMQSARPTDTQSVQTSTDDMLVSEINDPDLLSSLPPFSNYPWGPLNFSSPRSDVGSNQDSGIAFSRNISDAGFNPDFRATLTSSIGLTDNDGQLSDVSFISWASDLDMNPVREDDYKKSSSPPLIFNLADFDGELSDIKLNSCASEMDRNTDRQDEYNDIDDAHDDSTPDNSIDDLQILSDVDSNQDYYSFTDFDIASPSAGDTTRSTVTQVVQTSSNNDLLSACDTTRSTVTPSENTSNDYDLLPEGDATEFTVTPSVQSSNDHEFDSAISPTRNSETRSVQTNIDHSWESYDTFSSEGQSLSDGYSNQDSRESHGGNFSDVDSNPEWRDENSRSVTPDSSSDGPLTDMSLHSDPHDDYESSYSRQNIFTVD